MDRPVGYCQHANRPDGIVKRPEGRPDLSSLDVALAVLAVFRTTHFIAHDAWPPVKFMRERYLASVGSESAWADLALCAWCQSLWLAPVAVLMLRRRRHISHWLLLVPAISGLVGLFSTADSALGRIAGASIEVELDSIPARSADGLAGG